MIENHVMDLLSGVSQYITSCENLVMNERNLGCVDGKIIGTGRADYTQGSTEYNLTIGDKIFTLIDIPGIEGNERKYEEIIRDSLEKAHAIFYINGSGKKIEKATLEKVQKYMHDGTSVYAVFNVHCKAKKERIPGIDKKYQEELSTAYIKQEEIINQTEKELKDFLGSNYRDSLSLNGLLAFCGYAIDEFGNTTIIDDKDKNLRTDQKKYLNEYSGEVEMLREDAHIGLIKDIIDDKVDNFENDIYFENIKKLRNRLHEMIVRMDILKTNEIKKIHEFIGIYDEFDSNCINEKEDNIHTIKKLRTQAVVDGFIDIKEILFSKIEEEKGKTTAESIQNTFNEKKDEIIKKIQNSLNTRMSQAQNDYEEAIEDARQRLIKDFKRGQLSFEIALSSNNIELDASFIRTLNYSIETFGGDFVRVASLALSGASIGSLIAVGPGTAIGAAIGAILGAVSCIVNFFVSENKRINKAKQKCQEAIDEVIDEISEEINSQLKKLNYEEKIDASYQQIYDQVEKQKQALRFVENLLNNVTKDLKENYEKVS